MGEDFLIFRNPAFQTTWRVNSFSCTPGVCRDNRCSFKMHAAMFFQTVHFEWVSHFETFLLFLLRVFFLWESLLLPYESCLEIFLFLLLWRCSVSHLNPRFQIAACIIGFLGVTSHSHNNGSWQLFTWVWMPALNTSAYAQNNEQQQRQQTRNQVTKLRTIWRVNIGVYFWYH